jgi:hypothetical protein
LEEKTLPHVVLNGQTSIDSIFEELKPIFIRNGSKILRTLDFYLERGKNAILIDSLVVESERTTSFLAMITGRNDGVVVRLYPKTEVQKTDGVKKILAEIAKQLLRSFPGFKLGETNLGDYLT